MVGLAVCGLGNWGWNVLRMFASQPKGKLLYACDLSEKTRQKAAAAYPKAAVTDNLQVALDDSAVDAVTIAADAPARYEILPAAEP